MQSISVTQVPKPIDRKIGEHDLLIGWFPEPLSPIERRLLVERGAYPDQIGCQKGYHIEASFGTLRYYEKQNLIREALEHIKQHPQERYLGFWSH